MIAQFLSRNAKAVKAGVTALLTGCAIAFGPAAAADDYVRPYVKRDGTFVEGHFRSSPNGTNWDNYSSQGNYNPYTGRDGSRARDYTPEAYNYGGGRAIHEGPRGGQYYYSDSGRRVYVPKR